MPHNPTTTPLPGPRASVLAATLAVLALTAAFALTPGPRADADAAAVSRHAVAFANPGRPANRHLAAARTKAQPRG